MGLLAERRYYDGFSYAREAAVIRAWFNLYESRYEHYAFNLRLGEGIDPGSGYSVASRIGNILNTQSRVDVAASR